MDADEAGAGPADSGGDGDTAVEPEPSLPPWYLDDRVQALLPAQRATYRREGTWTPRIAPTMRDLGVHTYQVMGHYSWDAPHFPSSLPTEALSDLPSYVGDYIAEARRLCG